MKRIATTITVLGVILLLTSTSCNKKLVFLQGDYKVSVETGDYWIREYPLFLGIELKLGPQFAIWLEDTSGNYLNSIYVTQKMATESWKNGADDRRVVSLPHWGHQRGIMNDRGIYLPTKESPVTDGTTGATPKANSEYLIKPKNFTEPIVIKAEFNHADNFNDNFIENDDNPLNGQPSMVYSARFYPGDTYADLKYIGNGSLDGSDGNLYNIFDKLTTAKEIVKSIKIELIK